MLLLQLQKARPAKHVLIISREKKDKKETRRALFQGCEDTENKV